MWRSIFITGFILLVALLHTTQNDAYALDVKDMRFGVYQEKIRLVLDIDKVTDFRTFVLDSPYRIVLDLPSFEWKAGQTPKPPQAKINDIRQGKLNSTISRIVLDMQHPIMIESAFLLPSQDKKTNRIVIDYKFVDKPSFTKNKSTIHGTLTVTPTEANLSSNEIPRPPQNTNRPSKNTIPNVKKPLIIIDPGHGGQDPGAHSKNKIYEKNVVLALSKELKKQLLNTGKYNVLLTRESDVYIRLKDRVKFARDHEADLFISIHADSIHKPNVHGTSVYTISKKASDAQTAKLAEKENQSDLMAGLDLNIDDEQVAFILGDFLMNDTMNQSKFFANTLVSKFKHSNINTLENPHRYAGFAVLKAPDIPSVLIEAGFMSNAKEAKLLNQNDHRKKISQSIVNSVNSYFSYARENETR
ncbi:MAG: N-acetylmuramoyl-L-alanine amidase [Alphaproteobacteria bacterium]